MSSVDDRLLDLARRLLSGETVDWVEEGIAESEVREGMKRLRKVIGRPDLTGTVDPPLPVPGERYIGDFRLVRTLGEGGMGVVYEAEQQRPKRPVALKVIRGGRHVDAHTLRLFQREIQTLARLSHPGIAQLYETGVTDDGMHFFAMELIRGVPLAEWLRKRSDGPVTTAEMKLRLGVFRKICDAVAYAHQKGVIHRDLKPSNILIPTSRAGASIEDAIPEVKILDFGLARMTDTDVQMTTYVTEMGKVQGTLPYMSPEQVRGNPDEIDLRTDVYSLGVILYEMVTGRLPYDLSKAQIPDAVRIICEEPPKSLGTTFSGTRRLDGDVATIAGKCLEKETARRYQSAAALGEEVQRYLTDQPILARPPSAGYQIRKLVMRHKLPFAFAGAVFVLLAVLAGAMTVQAARIARERDRANLEAGAAKQATEFLVGLFEMSDPNEAKGNRITAREILDVGSRRIQVELKDQPLLQARLMETMGTVYGKLGLQDEAKPLLNGALKIRESILGTDSLVVADSLIDVGGEANVRRALAIREKILGPDHADTAYAMNALASIFASGGDSETAMTLLERALSIFEKQPDPANEGASWVLTEMALGHYRRGDYPRAKALFERALRIKEHVYGPVHTQVAMALNNLAYVLMEMEDLASAKPLLERAIAIDERILPPGHPGLVFRLHSLGELLRVMGRPGEARPYLERAVAILERNSPDASVLAPVLTSLALALDALGETRLADASLARALVMAEKGNGVESEEQANSLAKYAAVLRRAGQTAKSDRFDAYAQALRARRAGKGTSIPKAP